MTDTRRTLTTFYDEKGFVANPDALQLAMTGWIENGSYPTMCKHDCYLGRGEIHCEHGNPSVLPYFKSSVIEDATLLVNLKRLGVITAEGLEELRKKYLPKERSA